MLITPHQALAPHSSVQNPARHPPLRVLGALALTLAIGSALGGLSYPAQAAATPATVLNMPASFADLAAQVQPTVVTVSTSGKTDSPFNRMQDPQSPRFPEGSPFQDFFQHFFEQRGGPSLGMPMRSQGSGFIIDAAGYIVTNQHVIQDAENISVTLQNGTQHVAKLIGQDKKTDLALLKITTDQPLSVARLGDADQARIGDWVVAVGNPFGLGGSFSAGIISARGRDINSGPYDDFLQIDAPINHGNSGGPLFNTRGEVIGINTAIYSPNGGNVGIGFALPINVAEPVLAQLKSQGRVERGWLGVQIQKITPELAESLGLDGAEGALVASVVPDTPAAAAKLQAGDVITAVNDEKVKDYKELSRAIAAIKAGHKTTLQVWRQGQSLSVEVTLGNAADTETALSSQAGDSQAGASLGLSLQALTPAARAKANLSNETTGVLISAVLPGSPADQQGLRPGDVILSINQQPTTSPQQVVAKVAEAVREKQRNLLLLFSRQGEQRFIALKLG